MASISTTKIRNAKYLKSQIIFTTYLILENSFYQSHTRQVGIKSNSPLLTRRIEVCSINSYGRPISEF